MPGDYGSPEPPKSEGQGFCSSVCEWSCKGLAVCLLCVFFMFIVVIIFLGMMMNWDFWLFG
jgi:hypothetical protein